MFILILVITAVMLSDGELIPVDPPKTAALESYSTLQRCEEDRRSVAASMSLSNRDGEERTYHLDCIPAKRTQL